MAEREYLTSSPGFRVLMNQEESLETFQKGLIIYTRLIIWLSNTNKIVAVKKESLKIQACRDSNPDLWDTGAALLVLIELTSQLGAGAGFSKGPITCSIVAEFLAHKPVNFDLLTDNFIASFSKLLKRWSCMQHGKHKNSFSGPKFIGTIEKRAPGHKIGSWYIIRFSNIGTA